MIILATSYALVSQLGIDHFISIKLSDCDLGQGMLTYTYRLEHYTPASYSFSVEGDKVLVISSGYEVEYDEFEQVDFVSYHHASRYYINGYLDPAFGTNNST